LKKSLLEYKHIIWDWNGTILDDVNLCRSIINELLIDNNLEELSYDKYREIFTFPVREYYRIAGLKVEDGEFEELGKIFIDRYEQRKYNCKLFPEAVEVIKTINKNGIGQSVLSAYSQGPLDEFVSHFGLRDYFVRLVGLDNIYATSKLQNGKKWIKELSLKEGEILMIGDTLHDYDVACGMSADSLLVAKGHQNINKLKSSGTTVVESLSELL